MTLDRDELAKQLDQLGWELSTVFAASCAELLLPCFLTDATRIVRPEDAEVVDRARSGVWAVPVEGDRASDRDLLADLRGLDEISGDEEPSGLAAFGADGVAALYYALQCAVEGETVAAVRSAQRAADAAAFLDDLAPSDRHLQELDRQHATLQRLRESAQPLPELAAAERASASEAGRRFLAAARPAVTE